MTQKLVGATIYLGAALSMYRYYDSLDGSSDASFTIAQRLGVIGLFVLLAAFALTFWKRSPAVVFGAFGCALCWPDFLRVVSRIPFRHALGVVGYAMWNDTILASAMLVLATAFSLYEGVRLSR